MTLPRRTQAERSATTRSALLKATVETLVHSGHRGATNAEICRRARVSRGALLHHYATKAELFTAAVEHLFELRHAELRRLDEEVPPSQRVDEAFRRLWAIYAGPTSVAWMELVIAARSDPELRARLQEVSLRLEERAEDTLSRLFGLSSSVPARPGIRMVLAQLDGLAFHHLLHGDEQAATEALALFKALVEPFVREAR